jgi:OPA family phosphoglycerate-like MFS transporter
LSADRLLEKRIPADGDGVRGDRGLPDLRAAQFLASVQTMEIVPSFAVGSAVGLRGFMSYIFGASLGTSLFGVMVDKMGWHGGFYLLMGGIVCCILFCYLSHRGALELEQQRKNTQQQEAELALADAQ